jgi:parallel beta-helix repeat protein
MIKLLFILVLLFLPNSPNFQEVDANSLILNQPDTVYDGLRVKLGAGQPPGWVISIRADNITLQNSIIDAYIASQDVKWQDNFGILVENCSGVIIKDCQILNTGFDGVLVRNCSNVTISDCNITNCGEGILFEYSDNCLASGNLIENTGTSLNTTQDGIEWSNCTGGIGYNNTIRFVDGSGYDIFNSSAITVKDSFIYDYDKCGGALGGVSLQGAEGFSNFNTVDNIDIQKSVGAGIFIQRANFNSISNCSISDISISPGIVTVGDTIGNVFLNNDIRLDQNLAKYSLLVLALFVFLVGSGIIIYGAIVWIKKKRGNSEHPWKTES